MKIYHGQTLFSLIISISLSTLLMLVIIQFYSQTQQQNKEMILRLHLQNEIQRVNQLIGKDLRRTGFRALSEKLSSNNLSLFEQDENGTAVVIAQADYEQNNSCVLFFYDLDGTGCIGTTYKGGTCIQENKNSAQKIERELFGYRLNKKMLETRLTYKNAINQKCNKSQCQSYTHQPACNSGGWVDLLDENEIEIIKLQFNWLIENTAIESKIAGRLKKYPQIEYETNIIIPLLNQGIKK